MTREEAIEHLKEWGVVISSGHRKAVINMAIEALQETNGDGCDGCKYMDKDQYEMPCLICSKSHQNMYKRGDKE